MAKLFGHKLEVFKQLMWGFKIYWDQKLWYCIMDRKYLPEDYFGEWKFHTHQSYTTQMVSLKNNTLPLLTVIPNPLLNLAMI